MADKTDKDVHVKKPIEFTKEQLLIRFPECPDVTQVVLDESKTYTIEQAEKLVNAFLKVRDK